jgi:hypothetical protein
LWFPTKDGITVKSGGTLDVTTAGSLSMSGSFNNTAASRIVTGAATVGTTLDVTGDLAVNTTKAIASATTGNFYADGTSVFATGLNVGAGSSAAPIVFSPGGVRFDPGAGKIGVFFDGDVKACRHADTKTANMSVTWA